MWITFWANHCKRLFFLLVVKQVAMSTYYHTKSHLPGKHLCLDQHIGGQLKLLWVWVITVVVQNPVI